MSSTIQQAVRSFLALPTAAQTISLGFVCFAFGSLVGWGFAAYSRYSPNAYAEVSRRADAAERDLIGSRAQYATLAAGQHDLEQAALRSKLAAESSAKDVVMVRKAMASMQGGEGIPDWASAEKWQAANDEISRLKADAEKAVKELASKDSKIDRLRKLAEKQTARASKEYEKSHQTRSETTPGSLADESAAKVATETFVKRQLAHPSTASFPWFDKTAKYNGDGSWTIRGSVKARNSFNLETTMKYVCRLKRLDEDRWEMVDCNLVESDE